MTSLEGVPFLVTGATGFIGSHLAERLVAEGAAVTLAVEPGASKANVASILGRVRVCEVDLRDGETIQHLVREFQPSKVYHLAAVGVTDPRVDPRLAAQVNMMGTLNLLEALKETECDCFVNTGTCYEYGHNTPPMHEDQMVDPINTYAASKSAAWLFCNMYHRTLGYPVVTVRPFTVYGPRQGKRGAPDQGCGVEGAGVDGQPCEAHDRRAALSSQGDMATLLRQQQSQGAAGLAAAGEPGRWAEENYRLVH